MTLYRVYVKLQSEGYFLANCETEEEAQREIERAIEDEEINDHVFQVSDQGTIECTGEILRD